MDIMEIFKTAGSTGAWGLLAVFLIKYFIDDKAKTIERLETSYRENYGDMRLDKNKLTEIIATQKDLLIQQKEILSKQTDMLGHYEDILNGIKTNLEKITDIQLLHANRLEKIESRLERLERYTEPK